GAVPVVVVQPGRQRSLPLDRAAVGPTVGPLPQQGLNEALCLPVGLRAGGTGAALGGMEGPARGGGGAGAGPAAGIAQQPQNLDPAPGEPLAGAAEEGRHGHAALIQQDFGIGHAAAVIERDVDVLPADAVPAVSPVPGNPMADARDPAELLDVDVQQLA